MQQVHCDLCQSSYYSVVYEIPGQGSLDTAPAYKITRDKVPGVGMRLVKCLKCGLVYMNPQAAPEAVEGMYRQMQDDEYLAEERGRRLSARRILKKIGRVRKGGRLLEVGCATGFLVDEAGKAGWEAQGVEVSPWAAQWAREKLGLKVTPGTLEQARFPSNYFDAVVMVDVIEHLCAPRQALTEVRRILKPDGVLCLSAPDIESLMSRILRARWWGIQHSHLFYFSRATLSKMLDAAGFKPLRFDSHARVFSVSYWGARLKQYSEGVFRIFDLCTRLAGRKGSLLTLNFRDQLDCVAVKKRSLAYLESDEERPLSPGGQRKAKVTVVLPAYNAARTLERTVADIPRDVVDRIILVDDASRDSTVEVARKLGLDVFVHERNKGYGGNQKTCYDRALQAGADIVVMVHPDYQYDPTAIPDMVAPILRGDADAVFGSRMMKGGALEGGMPLWKHNVNILLSALENVVLGTYLTEYHSGFRAYSARYLKAVNYRANSDGFVFDNEIIVQGLLHYMKIEEVPIKTRYFSEASTIKPLAAVWYGLGILGVLCRYLLHVKGIVRVSQFE